MTDEPKILGGNETVGSENVSCQQKNNVATFWNKKLEICGQL